ncbi:MAG: hypothetical protein R3B70_19855 [Polyangiaceae bacterium]
MTIGRFLGAGPPLAVLVRKPRAGASTHVVPTTAGILLQDRWPKGALLLLRAEAEAVDCARRATSPAIAAHLLARYLLLAGPGVTARASEELAVRALEQIR